MQCSSQHDRGSGWAAHCPAPALWMPLQVEETLSTLSYATRTKNIHNRPTVQYDPREAQISLLRREIELLRQENTLLKEQLRGAGEGHWVGVGPTPTTTTSLLLGCHQHECGL